MKQTLKMFGNISIPEGHCPNCDRVAFIIKGKFACCDTQVSAKPRRVKRETEPEYRRRKPTRKYQEDKLLEQDNKCFYCGSPFGGRVLRGIKTIILRPNWDHVVPFDYSQNNKAKNFVASCQICNGIKSNKCFSTLSEAREDILPRWEMLGIKKLFGGVYEDNR